MPLLKAEITAHAWKRFVERWEGEPPEDFNKELVELLSTAKEVALGSGAAIRTIKNGFIPARYFESGYWRFVTDEEITKIMTIERPYISGRRPMKKPFDRKRFGKL